MIVNESTGSADGLRMAGTVRFAGVMLLTLGAFQAMEGLRTLLQERAYLVTPDGMLIALDWTVWGWGHLVLGLICAATGWGVLRGLMWARVAGVLFTAFAALAHFALLAAAPLWCSILICVEVVIIYALCAHGSEVRHPRR
ncbi:hypothetical protein Ait01nite_037300 [Actinoplanes italicus]|uniref:DUF7144 domain-containing protein n=1 Tax=Actinoplanes italicus TaxID=113567 RepID=A0A2T0K896_9ACTN|nr:hypothetical protein [Actinoplanes italicus]PRX19300.1 hypothetical protein CLV67_11052 [Actinoplanes italicus]GIE30685.1 hypothetical protein Ait01nite_037300 [Actinoplanes italicus]